MLSSELKRSTSGLPKIPHISWTVCGWSIHSSEGTLLRDSMSSPRFSLPGTCIALSERKLSWAHLKRTISTSFISNRFNNRWRSSTIKLAMDLPWVGFCLPANSRGRVEMRGQWLQGRQAVVSFHLSHRRPKLGRRKKRHIGGTNRVQAKIWWSLCGPLGRMVKLVDEGPGGALARSIHPGGDGTVPRGWPFQTQLLHSVRQDAEKIGIHAWAGCPGLCRMQEGWVVVRARQLLRIWSRQWQAVVHLASSLPPNETRLLADAEGCWSGQVKRMGENSLWGEWGTRGYSRHKLTHLRVLRSSAPPLFPRRSLGGKKREGLRGGVALWKES